MSFHNILSCKGQTFVIVLCSQVESEILLVRMTIRLTGAFMFEPIQGQVALERAVITEADLKSAQKAMRQNLQLNFLLKHTVHKRTSADFWGCNKICLHYIK